MPTRRRRDRMPPPPSSAAPATSVAPSPKPVDDPRVRFALLFLRLFLGVTFVYAALQKISDPGFLHAGSATYIGAQLTAFARTSPIGFLLTGVAIPLGALTGIGVILTELGVGLLVLAGVFTRPAAWIGALVNLTLFLTASWQVQPYFLGSDSIYAVAWVVLAVAGDQGFLTLAPRVRVALNRPAPATRRPADELSRRQFLVRAGGAAVGLVWILALLPRIAPARATGRSAAPSPSPAGATPSAAPSAVPTPSGTAVGTLSQLQAGGGSLQFQVPANGDPGVVVGLGGSKVAAFDAVCTHAGCTVEYDGGQKLLVCPCHGAEYDPANAAQVVAGPAPSPLTQLNAQVGPDGTIYVS